MFSASLVPTVVRKVLRNNYQSHYLIGPYHFCEIMHGLGMRLGRTYSQQQTDSRVEPEDKGGCCI